ncbi:uncharacterized protein TRIADDRAFT_59971 [Trichoplax adhaerens]|uniref:F-box domain-containing protein n=1 Tax=Trichoplax adhaerens TaxID=10228 RepID=B3S6Y3_TRIAD|nr:predicted protein [Trichoplax adhaerens]EDV21472.1 predicted protein [Trichoplax adhaerens]|eukprot:XP_002116072.1 predicted protein [Trichoplax adhaerens]
MEKEGIAKDVNIFSVLPQQVIIHITSYLTGCDLTRLANTCLSFYKLTCDDTLWRRMIQNELTCKPQLLKDENHFMYYKRAYLGQYNMLCTFVLKNWDDPQFSDINIDNFSNHDDDNQHSNTVSNYSTYAKDTYILEKLFSYGNYLKTHTQTVDSKILSMYLCHAAKHGYEVWAILLLERGALFSGVNFFNLKFYPINIAIRESRHNFIRQIIRYFLKKYSGEKVMNAIAGNNNQGSYNYASSVNSILIEIVDYPSQLKSLLMGLKLTPECRAAVEGKFDQLRYYVETQKLNCFKQDIYGMDPLRYATIAGHFKCCEFLIDHNIHYNHCRSSLRVQSFIEIAIDKMGVAMLKTLRQNQTKEFSTCSYDEDPINSYHLAFTHAMAKALARPSHYSDYITFLLPDLIKYNYYKMIFDHVVSIGNMNMFRSLVVNYKQLISDYAQNGDESLKMMTSLGDARNKAIRYVEQLQHPQLLRMAFQCISDLPNVLLYESSRLDHHLRLNVFNDWSIFSSSQHYDTTVGFYYRLSQIEDNYFNPKRFALELTSYNLLIVLLELINRCDEHQRSEILFCMFWSVMNMEWNHRLFQDEKLDRRLDQITECYFEAILDAGYQINDCTRSCRSTAAHYAITMGKTHWVQFFLAAGADRHIENIRSLSLPKLAQSYGVAIDLLNSYCNCPLPSSKHQNISFWWLK